MFLGGCADNIWESRKFKHGVSAVYLFTLGQKKGWYFLFDHTEGSTFEYNDKELSIHLICVTQVYSTN